MSNVYNNQSPSIKADQGPVNKTSNRLESLLQTLATAEAGDIPVLEEAIALERQQQVVTQDTAANQIRMNAARLRDTESIDTDEAMTLKRGQKFESFNDSIDHSKYWIGGLAQTISKKPL